MYANDAPWNDPDPDSTEPQTMTRKKVDVFGLVLTSMVAIVATVILALDFAWSTFFGVLFVYVLIFLSWFLVRRSKPVDHGHPNNHTKEVCEECDPIQMRDGGPVTNIVWWYAANIGSTRETADRALSTMPSWQLRKLVEEHSAYLKHSKFRNYPRP